VHHAGGRGLHRAKVGDVVVMPFLLTLSDVMGTGHHAAVSARVRRGRAATVVGDGAVGPYGVIAAKRLGAEQIILLDRNPDRIASAKAIRDSRRRLPRSLGGIEPLAKRREWRGR
jgi:Zn-dependent alcohol dehydrogenase